MKKTKFAVEVLHNIVVGLTVSFIALSLGAAFGILSGRGAFAGMISSGIFCFFATLLGGTRIKCSGPTAPMSAISAVVVAAAYDGHLNHLVGGFNPDHFINIVFILTAVLLLLMAVFRMGRFITLVSNVVVSGFMSGIAVLIWRGQLKYLFGFGGKQAVGGPMFINLLITLTTIVILFVLPVLLKKIIPRAANLIPSTLGAMVLMSVVTNILALPIEHVTMSATLHSLGDFGKLVASQWPTTASWSIACVKEALPLALQLAVLCYLDTLLTSLVVDKMTGEKTKQSKELMAQSVATGAVALVGGIPGAQATIRSVLLVKEGATQRIAGVFVGVFVLLEMLVFQHIITYIPQAVFIGILLKVGYDVCDLLPIKLWLHEFFLDESKLTEKILLRHRHTTIFVSDMEMLLIMGTILVTVLYDLNIAVVSFTLLFYSLNKFVTPKNPLADLKFIRFLRTSEEIFQAAD